MTEEIERTGDPWVCNPGAQIANRRRHEWTYPRRQVYRCAVCGATMSKTAMKGATDA